MDKPQIPMPSQSRDVMPKTPGPRTMTGPFAPLPGGTDGATGQHRVLEVYRLIEQNSHRPAAEVMPRWLRDRMNQP